MTALAKDRKTEQFGTPDVVYPQLNAFPVAAATTIYGGALVATNAAGYAVPVTASNVLKVWGRAEKQVINTVAAGFGSAGDLSVTAKPGVFYFDSGTAANAITFVNVGAIVFASDDHTVNLTDNAGQWPAAGIVLNVRADGQVAVLVGVGFSSLYGLNPEVGGGLSASSFKARAVKFANVASLASAAVATDGVTLVAGDIVLLTAQTTATQNGPYVVGVVGGGNAPLTRPDWWPTASGIIQGIEISVGGEGTIFAGSAWKAMCGAGKLVDTDDPVLYPKTCKAIVTLAAGTKTLGATEGLFLFSTTKSNVQANMNTPGGTLGTNKLGAPSASRVAGVSGVGVVIVNSYDDAGTVSGETSTVDVLVTNW